MAATTFVFTVRDNAASPPGTRMTGLTPTWVQLKKLSDNTNATQPSITEIGQGAYKFSYDAVANGEAAGQIDAGNTLTNPSDRYIDVVLTLDTNANIGLGATGLDAIATTDPLKANAATWTFPQRILWMFRNRGGGKTTLNGTTETTYAGDDTTVMSTSSVTDDGTTQTVNRAQ